MIPDHAEALVDIRTLPGEEDAVLAEIRELIGDEIEIEIVHRDVGLEAPTSGALVDAVTARAARARPRRARVPVPALGRHRQQVARRGSASPATASRRCGCPTASTSRRCSTGSTSACRSTH